MTRSLIPKLYNAFYGKHATIFNDKALTTVLEMCLPDGVLVKHLRRSTIFWINIGFLLIFLVNPDLISISNLYNFSVMLMADLGIIFATFKRAECYNMFNDTVCHNVNTKHKTTEEQNQNESKFVLKLYYCNVILGMSTTLVILPILPGEKVPFSLASLPEKYHPPKFMWAANVCLGILITNLCFTFIYFMVQLKHQLKHLQRKVELIGGDYFDSKITRSLKDCIRHHQEILRKFGDVKEVLFWTIPLLVFGVIGMLMSVVLYLITEPSPVIRFRVFVSFISMISNTVAVTHYGQSLCDQFTSLNEELCKTKWYDWSLENQKMLLTFMMGAKDEKVEFLSTIRMEYTTLVVIYQGTYNCCCCYLSYLAYSKKNN